MHKLRRLSDLNIYKYKYIYSKYKYIYHSYIYVIYDTDNTIQFFVVLFLSI